MSRRPAATATATAGDVIGRGQSLCRDLVGHIREEQDKPAMPSIWAAAERAVPYDGPQGGGETP